MPPSDMGRVVPLKTPRGRYGSGKMKVYFAPPLPALNWWPAGCKCGRCTGITMATCGLAQMEMDYFGLETVRCECSRKKMGCPTMLSRRCSLRTMGLYGSEPIV